LNFKEAIVEALLLALVAAALIELASVFSTPSIIIALCRIVKGHLTENLKAFENIFLWGCSFRKLGEPTSISLWRFLLAEVFAG